MKRIINLTESDLRRLVGESVKRVLIERKARLNEGTGFPEGYDKERVEQDLVKAFSILNKLSQQNDFGPASNYSIPELSFHLAKNGNAQHRESLKAMLYKSANIHPTITEFVLKEILGM